MPSGHPTMIGRGRVVRFLSGANKIGFIGLLGRRPRFDPMLAQERVGCGSSGKMLDPILPQMNRRG
jgi:hypothetical protein